MGRSVTIANVSVPAVGGTPFVHAVQAPQQPSSHRFAVTPAAIGEKLKERDERAGFGG
jgi:hypothetical protein